MEKLQIWTIGVTFLLWSDSNDNCKYKYFVAYFCLMLTKILSASHFGLTPNLIEVEVNVFKKDFLDFL